MPQKIIFKLLIGQVSLNNQLYYNQITNVSDLKMQNDQKI